MIIIFIYCLVFSTCLGAQTRIETQRDETSLSYSVFHKDSHLYRAISKWSYSKLELTIVKGHERQLGKLLITNRFVKAYDKNKALIWQSTRAPKQKLCVPELFAEFIKSHHESLKKGEVIICFGPVMKAKKLAPFKVRFIGAVEKGYKFEIGAGSLGMWFFMDPIEILFDQKMETVIDYTGVTPAPNLLTGTMTYLVADGTLSHRRVEPIWNSPLW